MKTIEVKLYSIEGLSPTAQSKAHDKWLENFEDFWSGDNVNTLKKFCEAFNLNLKDYGYGYRGEGVTFSTNFDHEEETENLTGFRLAKFILNNYGDDIFTPKYYGHLTTSEKRINHKRITSKEIKSGSNKGKFINSYHSAISKTSDCPLTGDCMDYSILEPIHEFLRAPRVNVTFLELLEDCMNSWVKACNEELEYRQSFDYFLEECGSNDWYFEEDGTLLEFLGEDNELTTSLKEVIAEAEELEKWKKEAIKWSAEDIIDRADNPNEITLTEAEAQEILERMIYKHDCNYGITWDTIDYYINEFKK